MRTRPREARTTVPAEASPPPSVGPRLPGVEGLRAVAAGSVLVFHSWLLDGGERLGAEAGPGTFFLNLALGVTLFFALSGFLLYRPFAAAIARGTARPAIRAYLTNRALRILPAYWVILLVTALVLDSALVRTADGGLETGSLTDPIQLAKSALMVHGYDADTLLIGIGPAWSLAVEAVFYALLPLLVLGAAAVARLAHTRRRRVAVLLGPPLLLLLVGLSGKLVAGEFIAGAPEAGYSSNWHSVIERSFWAQADLFSFGMVAAVVHTEVVDGRVTLPRGWRPMATAAAVAIFLPCALTLEEGQLSYLPQNTAVALAAALLLAAVVFPRSAPRRPRLQQLLETRSFVAVGLVSYSLFLWHTPVVRWLADHGVTRGGWDGFGLNLALLAAIAGGLSVVTYHLVELPALRRKRREPSYRPADSGAQLEAAP